MSVVVVISQHLLNVFVQLANKRGFKTKQKKMSNKDGYTFLPELSLAGLSLRDQATVSCTPAADPLITVQLSLGKAFKASKIVRMRGSLHSDHRRQ
jgi:hypothetical protein